VVVITQRASLFSFLASTRLVLPILAIHRGLNPHQSFASIHIHQPFVPLICPPYIIAVTACVFEKNLFFTPPTVVSLSYFKHGFPPP